MIDAHEEYLKLTTSDPFVQRAELIIADGLDRSLAMEALVVALVQAKDLMINELMTLNLITPRQIELEDGTVYRYDAPNHVVPVTRFRDLFPSHPQQGASQ